MNSDLRETFNWLKAQGLPPLPIAPAQDPQQYPARERDGTSKHDQNGALIPAFTGKNPSFLDAVGIPHLIRHTQYQHQLPTGQDLQTWFAHPGNGIGTLGGWQNLVWIDVDVKQFGSQDVCNARVSQWLSQYPRLHHTFTERTHSGGWRLAVRVPEKTFTNFSLDQVGGQHVGEALGQGRFTVLAPTIGLSGQPYVNVQRVPPVWVERLEAIGVYPVSRRRVQTESVCRRPSIHSRPTQSGILRLEDLASAKAQAVLRGESPLESRSHSLIYALRELYGWENWAAENGVPIIGDVEALAREAGAALRIDAERVERIIQSLPDPDACFPAAVFAGGDVNAWKRIRELDQQVYQNLYPLSLRKNRRSDWDQNLDKIHQYSSLQNLQEISKININEKGKQNKISTEILSNCGMKEFVECLHYIVKHTQPPKNRDQVSLSKPKVLIQGKIYRIESNQEILKVTANGHDIMLLTQNGKILSTKITSKDLMLFRLEALRIQKRLRALPESKKSSYLHQNEVSQD